MEKLSINFYLVLKSKISIPKNLIYYLKKMFYIFRGPKMHLLSQKEAWKKLFFEETRNSGYFFTFLHVCFQIYQIFYECLFQVSKNLPFNHKLVEIEQIWIFNIKEFDNIIYRLILNLFQSVVPKFDFFDYQIEKKNNNKRFSIHS